MQRPSTSEFIFMRDPRRDSLRVRGDRLFDLVDQAVADPRRRDERLAVAPWPAVAGEVVEHVGDVGAELRSSVNRPKSVYRRAVVEW